MYVIMAAASCSAALASRCAKYVDDFRVPMLLGAQPPDAKHFPEGFSRLGFAFPEGIAAPRTRQEDYII
jgi:hypothetical protein